MTKTKSYSRARQMLVSRSVIALLLATSPAIALAAPTTDPVPSLIDVFTVGRALQDRNGDKVADYTNAEVFVGRSPSSEDAAAAADIAARLGFEVTSIDLPLKRIDKSGITFVVGQSAAADLGFGQLLAGDGATTGILQMVSRAGRDYLIIAGKYDSETLRAAEFASAWLPGGTGEGPLAKLKGELLARSGAANISFSKIALSQRGGMIHATVTGKVESGWNAPISLEGLSGDWAVKLSDANGQAVDISVTTSSKALPSEKLSVKVPDLSRPYAIGSLLTDSNGGRMPVNLTARISAMPSAVRPAMELAARLGLETTGYDTEIAETPNSELVAQDGRGLILIGSNHPMAHRLGDPISLPAGEGAITLISGADLGDLKLPYAILVSGDTAGTERAAHFLASVAPNLSVIGKGKSELSDVGIELGEFLEKQSPAGQAAAAVIAMRQQLAGLPPSARAVRLSLSLFKPDPGLRSFLISEVKRIAPALVDIEVDIEDRSVDAAKPIDVNGKPFAISETLRDEVTDFWGIVDGKLIDAVRAAPEAPVHVEARLSEPPEVRAGIRTKLFERLVAAGADPAKINVTILSAYKQGFSWLDEIVGPALEGKAIDRIEIRFAPNQPLAQWPQQSTVTPTRWLHEIYPIDEVLSRRLNIPVDKISFVQNDNPTNTYAVTAFDKAGHVVHAASFDPKFVARQMFDVFPDYETVKVTTGWISASSGSRVLADEQIETDLERVWDVYQQKVLPSLRDHVLRVSKGLPDPDNAPFFGELRIQANISEPDYKLGINQEAISAIDGINQDLTLFTRQFFSQLGLRTVGKELTHSGRIIPMVRSSVAGELSTVKVDLTGFRSAEPQLGFEWQDSDGRWKRDDQVISRMDLKPPVLDRIKVGKDSQLTLRWRVNVFGADRAELDTAVTRLRTVSSIKRARKTNITDDQVGASLDALTFLQSAGLYRGTLSYQSLKAIEISSVDESSARQLAERHVEPARSNFTGTTFNGKCLQASRAGRTLVQWDKGISPDENVSLLACLSSYPGTTIYKAGESYMGRPMWGLDIASPTDGSLVSKAKLSVTKPTMLITARQHANEVSSTSHVLRFAEELLSSPKGRQTIARVNFALLPIYNVDGAETVAQLSTISPNLIMSVGRFNALGEDITASLPANPILTRERTVREQMWNWWLPDVNLDPHGLASHEWVSPFGEYVGWPMSRSLVVREVWIPRGWHIPSFGFPAGAGKADVRAADFDILGRIGNAINADDSRRQEIEDARARYRKYGTNFDPLGFPLNVERGVTAYRTSLAGAPDSGEGRPSSITYFSGATEAEDEVVSGPALQIAAEKGLLWEKAILSYVLEAAQPAQRTVKSTKTGPHHQFDRRRIKSQ